MSASTLTILRFRQQVFNTGWGKDNPWQCMMYYMYLPLIWIQLIHKENLCGIAVAHFVYNSNSQWPDREKSLFKKYTISVWSNCWILYHQSSWFGSLWKITLFKGQYTCIILARFCLVQIIGISRVKIWWRCTFKHPTYQGNNQNEQGQLILS